MMTTVDSTSELSSFFDQTPDLICIAGKDGFFKIVNHAVENKLGYSKSELLSQPISSFIFDEDKAITEQSRASLFMGTPLVNFENRYVTKEGNKIWLHWTSIYLPDKKVVFAIAKDISERKRIEKEIDIKYQKFKGLASFFKSRIEEDKKIFARELQEELSQITANIKMDLHSILNLFPDIPELVTSRIEQASYMSGLMLQMIDKIAFEISPFMLVDRTLNENLKLLCMDFSLQHEVPCNFDADYDVSVLSPEIKMDFFRMCQNVLKNIMNYDEVQSVEIGICDTGNAIELTIKDEGMGLAIKTPKQVGALANMKERVSSLNGSLSNISSEENGSFIKVILIS
ncbi:MAG: PAS domain S-box protein [Ginsengibacter sp.]